MTFTSGFVALIGKPNVGKSTLVNALVGEPLAIVTPKPQTTRHRITGIVNTDASQIVFLDTPGYHESPKPLNQAMLEVVDGVIGDADVVCLLIEPDGVDDPFNRALFERIGVQRCLVVVNKADTVPRESLASRAEEARDAWGAREVIAVSALEGIGIGALIDAIAARLPEGPAYYPRDGYTDHNLRFLAAEIVREQVFVQMQQEIPYAAAVEVEEFREPRPGERMTSIRMSIIVERESQKGMVVGKGGARIKRIGSAARTRIEKLVDGPVYLDLRVRVEHNWTKDARRVKELGYGNR